MTTSIQLRGVRVNNLQGIDLDIPHRSLLAICGVSGSGKTSLALDTLYAEGQRRYLETFPAYTRQFLERLEKPAADKIEGIPPAVAVTHSDATRSSRATVGTATEIVEYLRLLFAKVGHVICHGCGARVRIDSPQSTARQLSELPLGTRFVVGFESGERTLDELREQGFVRVVLDGRIVEIEPGRHATAESGGFVVVDRLTVGSVSEDRLRDSLETAFAQGNGRCGAWLVGEGGRLDQRLGFSASLRCDACGIDYPTPEPRLFNFSHALGACPRCEGSATIVDWDWELIFPDLSRSLRRGAIAPWTAPEYANEITSLVQSAEQLGLPVDSPLRELTEEQWQTLRQGRGEFTGLSGFFSRLESQKQTASLRAFLNRWKSERVCPACHGDRLRPESLATTVGGRNLADLCRLRISEAATYFRDLELTDSERTIGRLMLEQIRQRLGYLESVGLGYLTLDRTLPTLSSGEAQRVTLTSAMGSSLVNMLYVLDEPSVGLHPHDVRGVVAAVERLRDRGNTVVVVEHEEEFLRSMDRLVEIGPGAGEHGGEIVFDGSLTEMLASGASLTGDYLAGRRGQASGTGSLKPDPNRSEPTERDSTSRRRPARGKLTLVGARGHNLRNLEVDFPLGVLCVVTGVSGAGKSSLVLETLYPALCRRKRYESRKPLPYDDVLGDGSVDDVMLIDQSPIGRSPRSNPVTYLKAFDEIRAVFADTTDARLHNYTASHFSFNVDGGRCGACEGEGFVAVDMQFLADVYRRCAHCQGTRYRREVLAVKYRGRSIADVLEMTVREAFSFFRGQTKVQTKLKQLIDVGLEYVRLGQPANTLSAGEAQRLKLAAHLSGTGRQRTLLILDEPTIGLHFADVTRLLDCFSALLAVGHSLIVVEHNLQMMRCADWLIDLGPGAGDAGGTIVAQGTPEQIAANDSSVTGRFL